VNKMSELVELICVNCKRRISTLVNKPVAMVCSSCGGKFWIKSLSFRNIRCLHCGFSKELEARELVEPHLCIKNRYSNAYCVEASSRRSIGTVDSGNEKLLFVRGRGMGDLLMCTPAIRELKRRYSNLELWVACDEEFFELFYNNPNVNGWIDIKRHKNLSKVVKKVMVDEQLENYGNIENRKNRIDRIFEISGVEGKNSLDYFVADEEVEWAQEFFKSGKKRVGFGLQAGIPYRNWSLDQYRTLSDLLIKDNYEVILFGDAPILQFGSKITNDIINTTGKLSIRQLGAALQMCSVVVCGDTGISHFCAALGVKNIIFYGSIPPDVRCKYYSKAFPMLADVDCSPCWDSQTCTIEKRMNPECMTMITPQQVHLKIKEVLTSKKLLKRRKKAQSISDISVSKDTSVSVIVSCMNNYQHTKRCIESIKENTPVPYQLIVLDNGSTDDTSKYLQDILLKDDTLISLPENIGFGPGNNLAAKSSNSQYLCFLNNDCEVGKGWMEQLMEVSNSFGLIGAKYDYLDVNQGRKRFVPTVQKTKWEYLEGWCLFIKKSLWELIGGFDEQFIPVFSEDADLSFKIKKLGFDLYAVPDLKVIHYGGKTVSGLLDASKISERNNTLLYDKWMKDYIPEPEQPIAQIHSIGEKVFLTVL